MLAEARRSLPDMSFEQTDIAEWRPRRPPDLIFANSSLQWLRNHEILFPRLMSYLAEGGALAVQMADNLHEPSHSLMRMIAADGPWTSRLAPIAETRAVIGTHIDYYSWLKPLSDRLDIWETTYVHPLSGVDEVVDWFRSGALRPFLDPLDPREQAQFLDRYKRDLADAYDADPDGSLLFLYPRLFIHARKGKAKGVDAPSSGASRHPRVFARGQALLQQAGEGWGEGKSGRAACQTEAGGAGKDVPFASSPACASAPILFSSNADSFASRARAQAAIAAGLVSADGQTVRKASDPLAEDARIEASEPHPWVSRGGIKLAAALDRVRPRSARASPASTSAPRPAASPTCCWRAARVRWWRSTSAEASSTRASPPTRG